MSDRSKTSPRTVAGAPWLSWPGTVRIFEALAARDHKVRAVGGAVRDTLLDRPVQDVDFATDASPETVMELGRAAGLKAVPTGIDHGTVTLVVDHHAFEVTTLREDVETFGRHATVSFTDDWAADASRRDFTINALYADGDGTLFDPLGAIADIQKRRVRFIGDARARVQEDYLRILRFFRFNADLMTDRFDADGLSACVRERNGLRGLSGERVAGELMRLLRAGGAVIALWKMFDHGLLADVLRGVPNMVRFERLAAIETALGREPDALLRLGGLNVLVAEDATRLAAILRLSNAERDRLVAFARMPDVAASANDAALCRLVYAFGTIGAGDAVLKSWAASDAQPSSEAWHACTARVSAMPVPEFPLQGADLVGLGAKQGPGIGDVLKLLEAQWLESGCTETKRTLLAAAKALLASDQAHRNEGD